MSGRPPAPPPLRTVQEFVNTLDVETGTDALSGPAALTTWLAGAALVSKRTQCAADDVTRAVEVREALRAMLEANAGAAIDPDALALLNEAGAAAGLTLRFEPGGSSRPVATSGGVTGALGEILSIVAGAMADGTWTRLKSCRAHSCKWAFYDQSRNRSGAWCVMSVCGNRAKARSFRDRSSR